MTTTADNARPRIVYIHGDGVVSWRWRWVTRLQRDLEDAGFATCFELMPDSIEARARYWLPFLLDHVKVSEHDVLLGWSCGAVAAMRVAEQRRVRGLSLVAPYYTDLGLESVRAAGWVGGPWDWAEIKAHSPQITLFYSDDDPYIEPREFVDLQQLLAADAVAMTGEGHFVEREEFPELTSHLIDTYAAR